MINQSYLYLQPPISPPPLSLKPLMMLTENLQPTTGRGGASSTDGGNNRKPPSSPPSSQLPKPTEPLSKEPLKCPRCDSTQTKFCYYNNYSLSQPRHFCKACRRYWTKGGSLRNVPIGGGCRKNKKVRSSSTSSSSAAAASRILSTFQHDASDQLGNITSAGIGGLKFFHGLTTPAVDFHLGGLRIPGIGQSTLPTAPPPPPPIMYPQFPSFADISTSNYGYGLDLTAGVGTAGGSDSPCTTSFLGLNNHPTSAGLFKPASGGEASGGAAGGCGVSSFLEMGSNNLATSIESLSSINQELHWKLQQQRLAMLYGTQGHEEHEEEAKEGCVEGNLGNNNHHHDHEIEKPQPILFQNLEICSKENDHHQQHGIGGGVIGGSSSAAATAANDGKEGSTSNANAVATEWFFDNPYASSAGGAGVASTPCSAASGGGCCDNNENHGTTNYILAWSNGNHHQFNGLP